MRMFLQRMRDLWCIATHQCSVPLDQLEREDEVFASHMRWMIDRQRASNHRQRDHFYESDLLDRLPRHEGGNDARIP